MFGTSKANPKKYKISTVSELVREGLIEKPLDGNHGELHPKTSDFVDEGIPFIMANDLFDGKVDFSDCHFITNEQVETLRRGFVKPGVFY